jgi:hypothetical protein
MRRRRPPHSTPTATPPRPAQSVMRATGQVPVVTRAWLEACEQAQAQVGRLGRGGGRIWRRIAGPGRRAEPCRARMARRPPPQQPRKGRARGRAHASAAAARPLRSGPQVPMDPHLAGPFSGLVVSSTNFNLAQRTDVEAAVARGGGTFAPELQKGVCTHLVCGKPDGPKYRWARGGRAGTRGEPSAHTSCRL